MSEEVKKLEMPLPVELAQTIAQGFCKDLVIVLGYDKAANRMYSATYGKLPEEKQAAAIAGEVCCRALGCDLSKSEVYEDFRTRPAAEAAATIERLRGLLGVAKTALECGSPTSRNGAFDPECWLDLILRIRDELAQPHTPKPSGVNDGNPSPVGPAAGSPGPA